MMLIYIGKKKSFVKRLPLNHLYSKDFTLIQDSNNFVDDALYDIMGDDEPEITNKYDEYKVEETEE